MSKLKSFSVFGSGLLCMMLLLFPMQAQAAVSKADQKAYAAVFDAAYYAETYPDVTAVYGNDESALLKHFMEYGVAEGRCASAQFNPEAYKQRYTDLQTAFGNNMAEYCRHYVTYGQEEGRDGSAGDRTIVPPVVSTVAAVPVDGQLLGSYATLYDATIQRATNVELAASRINGIVIQPGDGFSFSQAILPRTRANGYVMATVFINKKHSKGIGGGICQVSSTLYAAMLAAGLPATERHPHSLPVTYIPKGMDATISGNTLDLRFDNTYTQPLQIAASAADGVLTVSLYLVDAE